MTDPAVFPFRSTGTGAGEVPVGFQIGEGGARIANPQATTVVQVRQLGPHGPAGPWTVTGATAATLQVDAPAPLARVTSPAAGRGGGQGLAGPGNVEGREGGGDTRQCPRTRLCTGRG